MRERLHAISLAVLLIVAGAADAIVLYFPADPLLRLQLGLVLFVTIVLVGSRLGVVEGALALVARPFAARRYSRTRALADELLEEVRRLNWTAVDAANGVRSEDSTIQLMDASEARMKKLVEQIRASAGESNPEPDIVELEPVAEEPTASEHPLAANR